ncbi:hypothetical protein [Butyrivibrio sp. MC2013]|uniref:hypothetical protein n=1 Tax=Butyrivibrio sp. MC2013 TaxID=1280686 RepID=UPI0004161E4E|nr:hypothetical protein [Butyrivibrio sp. MC2013]
MSGSKNGFGKFLFLCGLVAAAGAGAYYYMNKSSGSLDTDPEDDDFDDFDDFDDEDAEAASGRGYVNITSPSKDADDSSSDDEADESSDDDSEEFFDDETDETSDK